ncbi:flagellar basal-body rod protein FlgG [Paremcibacter congregatus]|uniref:Flagellar basal-body rod protein FlgG n=1 Tax=Paremcibacter congregatus TaxID=2043170 RepID=A0A2G4YM03_9PROT|nr:flagellar basal-body rod protein FlgG [Paremcibacter congregatus]PHZ83340.1 flagellar basal-body rod protein FlgG [Paremcibacter congregatus]QDE28187.1 flagellar basal-body rod protein FlgG [Paremcibacter congregatus]|tara:strand:+ start:1355 stop:2140 length:786 start_codon:yes stop_codon:yes gene_type:complete
MKALSIAATGMIAQQLNVEVISNNIANMNTTGFKRQRAEFQDLLYQNIERVGSTSSDAGTINPAGIQVGVGVKTGGVYRITEQGSVIGTENPLDMAINGAGYFRITLPSGEDAYTRAGSFQLGPTGQIVTLEGYTVAPGLTIPQEAVDVSINSQGEVLVKLSGQVDPTNLGRIELTTFPNPAGLEAIGDNQFLETPASGAANAGVPNTPGFGAILQSFLENSNVNSVSEVTSLITAQRAYEMNSKVISTADEMMSVTSNLR